MTDVKAWIEERQAIQAEAAPEAWTTIQRDGEGPAVVAVPDEHGYSPWQAYLGMCSGYDDENATAIVDAHNMFPRALDALNAVLEVCDKALVVKVEGSSEGEVAMAAMAATVKRAIEGAINE